MKTFASNQVQGGSWVVPRRFKSRDEFTAHAFGIGHSGHDILSTGFRLSGFNRRPEFVGRLASLDQHVVSIGEPHRGQCTTKRGHLLPARFSKVGESVLHHIAKCVIERVGSFAERAIVVH